MDITERAKQILKDIGAREKSFSQLQKKFGEDTPIGADVQLLTQLGALEDVDGFLSLTDVGLKLATIDGTEIPEKIESALAEFAHKRDQIKIDKKGDAARTFRRGKGIKIESGSSTVEKYKQGLERAAASENQRSIQPIGDHSEEGEPALEGAEEAEEPTEVRVITSSIDSLIECPVFGESPKMFCTMFCGAYNQTLGKCTMTPKMVKGLQD